MKKIIYSILSLVMLTLLVSCGEDTTAGISRIIYYPSFEISNGTQTDLVEAGSDYVTPTAIATEAGTEIASTTSVSGRYTGATEFDVNVPDEYTFTFSAVSGDGYEGSASKSVIVFVTGDMTTSLEGLYLMSVDRLDPAAESHANMPYAMITKAGDNLFNVSHGVGGFYSNGRGYGDSYRFQGMQIQVNNMASNDFSWPNEAGTNPGFGGSTTVSNMAVDAAAKTISWDVYWDFDYNFEVTYTQVQP